MDFFSLKLQMQYFNKELFLNNNDHNLSDLIEFLNPGPQVSPNNEKFRMLIDCDSCMDRLYGGYYPDYQSGGQWTTLHHFYEDLKKGCDESQIELIFFLNGTTPENLNEWLVAQAKSTEQIKNIYENFSPSTKAPRSDFVQPVFLPEIIKLEANNFVSNKHLFTFQSIENHQKEILDFCRQFKCDALLTNDLDIITLFLVNQHPEMTAEADRMKNVSLYQASSFKISRHDKRISVRRYNFEKILCEYDMTTEQFVWFSILLGTKYVPSTYLREFYKRVADVNSTDLLKTIFSHNNYHKNESNLKRVINGIRKFLKMHQVFFKAELIIKNTVNNDNSECGKFVAEQLWRSYNYYFEEPIGCQKIYWMVDSDELNSTIKKEINIKHGMLKKSNSSIVNMDDWINQNFFAEDEILNKWKILHVNSLKTPLIYQILTKQKLYLTATLEPINEHNKIRASCIYRPIREYLYTIIFSGFDLKKNSSARSNQTNVIVEEIIYDSEKFAAKTTSIHVIPFCPATTMFDIWNTSEQERLRHFLKSINGENMIDIVLNKSLERLQQQDKPSNKQNSDIIFRDYLIPCLALRYMIESNQLLCSQDIDAFLVTFVFTNSHQRSKFQNTEYRNSRAMHLANLFIKAIENLNFANDVCGIPIDVTNFNIGKYFNGIFFQHAYSHCVSNNIEFYKGFLHGDNILMLHISTDVGVLHNFVHYELGHKISQSCANKKQYETKSEMNGGLFNKNKTESEPFKFQTQFESSNNNLNNNLYNKRSLFSNDSNEKIYSQENISPKRNTQLRSSGRGILASPGQKKEFPIFPRQKFTTDNDSDSESNLNFNHQMRQTNSQKKKFFKNLTHKKKISELTAKSNLTVEASDLENIDYSKIQMLNTSLDDKDELEGLCQLSIAEKYNGRKRLMCDFTERI